MTQPGTAQGAGRAGALARLAAWSVRHRWWVLAFWVVLAGSGIATVGTTNSRLSTTFDLPGQPAWEANQAIAAATGGTGDTTSRWSRWRRCRPGRR